MLDLIAIFKSSQPIFLTAVGLISLIIGSFLNVIILRLPNVLQKEWRKQCYEFLETEIPVNEHPDLMKNRVLLLELLGNPSHCPRCNKHIKFYDNIPLLSYIFLRGKCRNCKKRISIQYPIIEGLAAVLATCVAWHFGVTWQTVAGCILTYVLLVQATIDFQHTIIPDELTLPMVWIGLLLSIPMLLIDSSSAIIGAISGYLSLWIIYWFFFWATKKEGMGYGDFKLLAMLGAWLGWQMLPFTVLFSSILGSIIGIVLILFQKKKREKRIPFGPFLATAGWIALLYGPEINEWYLNFAGI